MAENRGKAGGRRPPPGRKFAKGVSGNPGGRPKDLEQTRELARKYTRRAVLTLAKLCRGADKDSVRVAAATALLDRGWGKPAQPVTGKDGEGPVEVKVNDGELLVYLRKLAGGAE